MIQPMLAIWSLIPLPFLNPACTSECSRLRWAPKMACYKYCSAPWFFSPNSVSEISLCLYLEIFLTACFIQSVHGCLVCFLCFAVTYNVTVFCSNTALLFFTMSLWDRFLEVGFLSQRINACGISGGIANSPSWWSFILFCIKKNCPCNQACGILVPWPGIEPAPHELEAWLTLPSANTVNDFSLILDCI